MNKLDVIVHFRLGRKHHQRQQIRLRHESVVILIFFGANCHCLLATAIVRASLHLNDFIVCYHALLTLYFVFGGLKYIVKGGQILELDTSARQNLRWLLLDGERYTIFYKKIIQKVKCILS